MSLILAGNLWVSAVVLVSLLYYPLYSKREDFVVPRQEALEKEQQTDKIEVYNYISKNVPLDDVLLCEHDESLFPVMATGVKMVSIEVYFSNPYVSYEKRENDRNSMISFLTTNTPISAQKLFAKYKVGYVLLTEKNFEKYRSPSFATGSVVFKNKSFTIIKLNEQVGNTRSALKI